MPETDILNPSQGYDPTLGDSMNPSYGWTRKRSLTQLRKKAVGGTPWSRETSNVGHAFPLTWTGRTQVCRDRLKWYYEQYEDGFFTIVDWDAGGRHYVGHFTGDFNEVHSANNKWDITLTFEETPRVPMVTYPQDWDVSAIRFYANNDYKDQKVATLGTWAATPHSIQGAQVTTMDGNGTANDWAQFEYRGYGFRLFLLSGPEFGKCQVYLDGNLVTPDNTSSTTIDCYSAADVGPMMLCQQQNVSLDIHRVKVVALGTKNVAATATGISWHSLQVMR